MLPCPSSALALLCSGHLCPCPPLLSCAGVIGQKAPAPSGDRVLGCPPTPMGWLCLAGGGTEAT